MAKRTRGTRSRPAPVRALEKATTSPDQPKIRDGQIRRVVVARRRQVRGLARDLRSQAPYAAATATAAPTATTIRAL